MYLPSPVLLLLALFLEVQSAVSVHVQLEGRSNGLDKRKSHQIEGVVSTDISSGVSNKQDVTYTTTILIGGSHQQVLIDTGSSDLWLVGEVKGGTDTGISASITYAQGNVAGNIFTNDMVFAGHSIPQQAYINVTDDQNSPAGNGIIGLGPYTSSTIRNKLKGTSGDPVLNRIFASNQSTPNFLSFTLSRAEDPTQTFLGELTVGELVAGLDNITSTFKNPAQILPTSEQGSQHWSILVDSITGPDGQAISYNTTVPGQTHPVGVLDSGFSLPQVPSEVSDALYGRVQGAQWLHESPVGPAWQIPCEQELNASFTIGGTEYPIHPLDLSLGWWNPDGTMTCYGAFQPSTITSPNAASQFDMVLGMAFLRNTYTLINFGNFVDVNSTETEAPFIQFLSLTEVGQAHKDFVHSRLNGTDITSQPQFALLPPSQGQHSPATAESRDRFNSTNKPETTTQKHWWLIAIVASSIGGGLLVVSAILYCISRYGGCDCFRRGMGIGGGFALKGYEVQTREVYQRLNDHTAPESHPRQYGHHGIIDHGALA